MEADGGDGDDGAKGSRGYYMMKDKQAAGYDIKVARPSRPPGFPTTRVPSKLSACGATAIPNRPEGAPRRYSVP